LAGLYCAVFNCVGNVLAIWWLCRSVLRYVAAAGTSLGDSDMHAKKCDLFRLGIVAPHDDEFSAVLWMKSACHTNGSPKFTEVTFCQCAWISLATIYILAVLLKKPVHP